MMHKYFTSKEFTILLKLTDYGKNEIVASIRDYQYYKKITLTKVGEYYYLKAMSQRALIYGVYKRHGSEWLWHNGSEEWLINKMVCQYMLGRESNVKVIINGDRR